MREEIMNNIRILISATVVFASMAIVGCSSSKPASNATEQNSIPPPSATPQQEARHDRVDTLEVQTQDKQQPSYQSQSNPPPAPSSASATAASPGTYAVQVGAYKAQDAADRIAQLAKERLGRGVNVTYDGARNLYKVTVGTFLTKDDARSFRDEMVRKYPADYKDAWVAEHPQR